MGPSQPKGNRDPIGKIDNFDNLIIFSHVKFCIDLLKQERPPIRDVVYPGMQERGRAIPPHTVPILERPGVPGGLPPMAPKMVERRVSFHIKFSIFSSIEIFVIFQPGSPFVQGQPGPNMRAAAFQAQQHQKNQNSTSILMPIYTIGIVAFFVFTIVKIVMKRMDKKKGKIIEPEKTFTPDPVFAEKVFRPTQKTDPNKHKLGENFSKFKFHFSDLNSSCFLKKNAKLLRMERS